MHPLKAPVALWPYVVLFILGLTVYRAWILAGSGLTLSVDEAYYWGWAQQLDWGYYSKPPMIAWVIAFTTGLCGDGLLCVKLGSFIAWPITSVLLYLIGRRLGGEVFGAVSAVVFITLPGVTLSAVLISTDVMLFLWWTLAFWALLRALESNAWRDWLLLGLAGGLGLLSKYTMGVFALSLMLYLLWEPTVRSQWRNPRLYAAGILAALILSPNLWWNLAHDFPTLRHTADISNLENAGLHWDELGEFLGGQFAVFGPLFFVLLWIAISVFLSAREPRKRLLMAFTLPFLFIIALQALLGRANANWAAPAYVAGTLLVMLWLFEGRRVKLGLIALGLNLLLMFGAYHFPALSSVLGIEPSNRSDPYKRVRGWDRLAAAFDAYRARYPDARLLSDDRGLLAELIYYGQPHPFEAFSWNPNRELRHHYDLKATLSPEEGGRFLLVTDRQDPLADVHVAFTQVERLGPLHVDIHRDYALDYTVWLLERPVGAGGR